MPPAIVKVTTDETKTTETPGSAPSRFVHNVTRPIWSLIKGETEKALQVFNDSFPHGYAMVPTSGVANLCGLRALTTSTLAVLPSVVQITYTELFDVFHNILHTQDFKDRVGGDVPNANLPIDYLAVILQMFALQRGLSLALGYILRDSSCFLVPTQNSEDVIYVWIASNSLTGNSEGPDIDHFEGLVPSQLQIEDVPMTTPVALQVPPPSAPSPTSTTSAVSVEELLHDYEEPQVQEDFKPINPQVNQSAVYEPVPQSMTCFSFNGQMYSIASDAQLNPAVYGRKYSPTYTLKAYTREPNLRGFLSIHGTIDRDINAVDNPVHRATYSFYIEVNLKDVTSLVHERPGSWECTDFVNPADSLALLTIQAQNVRMSNAFVPTLQDTGAEQRLRAQNTAIVSCNTLSTFKFLLRFTEDDALPDILSTVLHNKWIDDRHEDQILLWFANDKIAHQLRQNNIHPPAARPALSQSNLVLALRRTHADPLEFKVFAIYALNIEYWFQQAIVAEVESRTMATAITYAPGSMIRTNENDNELPKLYRLSVQWNPGTNKPRIGDRFEVVMPFEIGPVTPYHGPPIPRHKTQYYEDFDEYADFTQGQTAEEKEDAANEAAYERRKLRRKVWSIYYWGPDSVTVPGEITLWAERPTDTLWEGPSTVAPTAPTEVPSHIQEFHSRSKFIQYVKSVAPRHQLSFTLMESTQAYKDLVRTINDLAELQDPLNSTGFHILRILVSGDLLRNPFRKRDLLAITDNDTFASLTVTITDYQRTRLIQTLSNIEHGVALIKGCPAAAKTVMLEISALLSLTIKSRASLLLVTDVNAGVNDMAARLARRACNAKMSISIVRIHSMEGEVTRVIAHYIQGYGAPRTRFIGNTNSNIDVPLYIDSLASKHADRKADARYDAAIRNLDLNTAVVTYIRNNTDQPDVQTFLTTVADYKANQAIGDIKVVRGCVNRIIASTLELADVVVTTCSLAIQNDVSSLLRPRFLFKDEDCRSWPHYFYALAAAYHDSVDTFFLAGDPVQKTPYVITETSNDGSNPFVREMSYTAFQRFEDMGIATYPFYEQHRMYNPK